MPRPLAGIQVVEICNVASGPFCGLLLADMGADVIKVENPLGGDSMRSWPPITDGFSENFASLNRNKRSVALDLKSVDDRAVALELIANADVLVENNRPGVMDRLGLGYTELHGLHPALVYCSISAYGQDGPRSQEAGFDLTIQAISGIMSVTGEPGGQPVKCGVPISDFATGLYAAFAIVSALYARVGDKGGVHIDASMLGSSLAIAALQSSQYFGTGVDPVRLGAAHPRNAPYEVFRCRDGHVAMAAGNNSLWLAFCKAFDRHDLADDERFSSTATRAENQASLKILVESTFQEFSRDELLSALAVAGVPAAPINSYSEALADAQVQAMGWVEELELPNGKVTNTFGSPLRFSGSGFPAYLKPPLLGEHAAELTSVVDGRAKR